MFRKRDPQVDLFESSNFLPPEKAARLHKTWADAFRRMALPLIDEGRFAALYSDGTGRPNKAVEVVLGVLVLKEMFDLTDNEALEQLEFNLLWHHALRLKPEDAHLCQKTLHNFRAGLMQHDLGRLAFEETTDRILRALQINVSKQRLDSTHIISNMATLTRLGLFCETIRVFLTSLRSAHPRLFGRAPLGICRRYLKEDGTETSYGDARSSEGRRRLSVCARDAYRLWDLFRGTAAAGLEEYDLLNRLVTEQCEVVSSKDCPDDDDDDAGEGGVPVRLKAAKEVKGDSLQSPHDPDATYSGHKGKGYEVQVVESCDPSNAVEIITDVAVTDSCDGDAGATIPLLEGLVERGLLPKELVADTSYGSAENAVDAACLGTELVSPVGGKAEPEAPEEEALTAADFDIDPGYGRPTVSPEGHESIGEEADSAAPHRVEIAFARGVCEACPRFGQCPALLSRDGERYILKADLRRLNIERRRRAEARGDFAPRYSIRAGIEATNSELKRAHGLGRPRVRGRPRVELAVYIKALACNIKRLVRATLAANAEPVAAAG
ncbi:MAG: transposase [Candidatus Eisenbacteria bacterium]|nr:transposase [Candidatus Eisenbacteria bacterium]